MTRAQARELTELIESMQHREAVEMVQSLVDPREDELRFTIVRDGRVTEARVFEPSSARDVETEIVEQVVQWCRQVGASDAKEFTVYRSTRRGTYEPYTSARRK